MSSQMLQRENKKKQILYKETNLTIAKQKHTRKKTKGLFYFNKNQILIKNYVVAQCHANVEKDLYS